jgi:hypothetical protein
MREEIETDVAEFYSQPNFIVDKALVVKIKKAKNQ